ncbi:hypothetical protein [Cytobacillus oceanisediminis]|uniref:hypothetical protein n=1 Tax=Cytobacillus oceanisediminis TaxID=665099 RepID=UPI001643041A|nr:hypothetical protein [Cytobacillus oceanisediminis]
MINEGIEDLKEKGVNGFVMNGGGDVGVVGWDEVGMEDGVLMGEEMMKLWIRDKGVVS